MRIKAIVAAVVMSLVSVAANADRERHDNHRDNNGHGKHQNNRHNGHHQENRQHGNHQGNKHHGSHFVVNNYYSEHDRGNHRHCKHNHGRSHWDNNFGDHDFYAVVVSVQPIYRMIERSVPQRQCWQEDVTYQTSSGGSSTGTIVGSLVGAAIGNELGHHQINKKVGAVAGAVLGASVGSDLSRGGQVTSTRYGTEERCEVSYENYAEQELSGYNVTYFYNGRNYTTFSDRHPGRQIRVDSSIVSFY